MSKNREKRPEVSGPGAGIEKEKIGKEEKESGEDILRRALKEVESGEEMRHLENEAYGEKEKRERYEEAKQREQELYERTLERCYSEGAATYMAFETAEKIHRLSKERRLDHKTKEQVIQESLKYLELLGYENDYHFKQYIDNASFNARGVYLLFGPFTVKMEAPFAKEGYLKAMEEAFSMHERLWEGREEGLEKNEILAIREKRNRQALVRHLEGFGTTALDHGDIETAVDAFIEGGLIENLEIAERITEKMKELIQSKELEIRAKALAAKKSLEEHFEEKKAGREEE